MNTAEHLLLIILSTALAVFIVLSIVAACYAIKLIQSLQRIANRAEGVVQSAESIAAAFKHAAKPASLFSTVKHIISMVQKAKAKK